MINIVLQQPENRIQRIKDSLFVTSEQRLDASVQANIQPAATKVTNRESFILWIRQPCQQPAINLSLDSSALPANN